MNLYGLTLALAIFVAYAFTSYRAKKRGLSQEFVWDSLPWVLVFGITGARIYHVLNYWNYYSQNLLLIPQIWLGGLGILGGLGGGMIGAIIYNLQFTIFNKNSNFKFKISNYLDAAAPAVVLGQALGRVGNILNGENLPYAYWEIWLDMSIFLILIIIEWVMRNRHSDPPACPLRSAREVYGPKNLVLDPSVRIPQDDEKGRGSFHVSMFQTYLSLYSLGRFGLEFARTDSPWIWGPLTVAQWVCLALIIGILFKARFFRVVTTLGSGI